MSELGICVLGDLAIMRDATVLDLPPSRKTRGLLAYLALNQRSFRREQLCELLWEIPDDPRGSLRWSLSKIRKLVDDEQQRRIIADRATVRFDIGGVDIDVLALHALADGELETASTAALKEMVDRYRGHFLEGLELPNFHEFYAWCIAQREQAMRAQAALLKALVSRHADYPDSMLDYSSRLVSLMPYDETARGALIQLLMRLGRIQEAEQQYRLGLHLLQELGAEDKGLLYRARHVRPGAEPAPVQPRAGAPSGEQQLTRAAAASPDPGLVGRDQELELLAVTLREVIESRRVRGVLIRGDPGMGKSRLLQATAALAREAGAGILKADAFESERMRPFAAWNDALRRALPNNPTSALLEKGERVTRDQVFTSLSELLLAQTTQHPVVVLFDDLQWCDESSASALRYLLHMHPAQPLLLVAAARSAELLDNNAVKQALRDLQRQNLLRDLELPPLAPGALRRIIISHAPDANAEKLSAECAGNPLLAIELARAESEGGTGNSLAELVHERMSRLDSDAVAMLHWAAVLAPRINIGSLEQVTGLERGRIDAAVESAERQGILHPGTRGFRFSHDLIAATVYKDIPPARLQVMHRRVAEVLEVDTALDLALAADLAHHAPKSGDPALAARAMVFAGRLCVRFYANEDALTLYRRGMEFAGELEDADRVCRMLELSDVRMCAAPLNDWEAAVGQYIELAEQALDHGALSHARLGYQLASYVRWQHGEWMGAHRDSLQAERVVRGATEEQHILGMAEAAKCLALLERDLAQADAMVMEACSLAARRHFTCVAIPLCLGLLRYYENRLDEAVEHFEDARTLCKSRGDRLSEYLANEYLAIIEVERDDFATARERCKCLLEIGSRLREGSELPFARALESLCRYGLEGSDTGLDDALAQLRAVDAKQRLAFLLNRAAILDLGSGRPETARARAREALQLATLMERASELLQAHITLHAAQRELDQGDAEGHVGAIRQLASGSIAIWVRSRADRVLKEVS